MCESKCSKCCDTKLRTFKAYAMHSEPNDPHMFAGVLFEDGTLIYKATDHQFHGIWANTITTLTGRTKEAVEELFAYRKLVWDE